MLLVLQDDQIRIYCTYVVDKHFLSFSWTPSPRRHDDFVGGMDDLDGEFVRAVDGINGLFAGARGRFTANRGQCERALDLNTHQKYSLISCYLFNLDPMEVSKKNIYIV